MMPEITSNSMIKKIFHVSRNEDNPNLDFRFTMQNMYRRFLYYMDQLLYENPERDSYSLRNSFLVMDREKMDTFYAYFTLIERGTNTRTEKDVKEYELEIESPRKEIIDVIKQHIEEKTSYTLNEFQMTA